MISRKLKYSTNNGKIILLDLKKYKKIRGRNSTQKMLISKAMLDKFKQFKKRNVILFKQLLSCLLMKKQFNNLK